VIDERSLRMISFSCPNCSKSLRADGSKAGSMVKCPACGSKLQIPEPEMEPQSGDDPEPKQPQKKKKPRFLAKSSKSSRGKTPVIIICCVVLGMHLVSLINYLAIPNLATPDPAEIAKKQIRENYEKMGKDLPKDFEQKVQQQLDKIMGSKEIKEMPASIRSAIFFGQLWMWGSFLLSAVLLICLYLRQDWARVVLGLLFLISVGLSLLGLVFGGFAALRFLGFLAFLEMFVRIMVNLVVGLALLKWEDIVYYTTH
jgi:DNA-directed RNA polymerase subunit RPC12/RpoP